jgi:hypothetical protein
MRNTEAKMVAATNNNDIRVKPCAVCGKQGTRKAVEKLPNGGILWMSAHDDDSRPCKWVEATDIDNFARPQRRPGTSPIVTCPKCKKRGNLTWFLDDKAPPEQRDFSIRYYVRHKIERCMLNNSDERTAALKQVDRYIADPPRPQGDNTEKIR